MLIVKNARAVALPLVFSQIYHLLVVHKELHPLPSQAPSPHNSETDLANYNSLFWFHIRSNVCLWLAGLSKMLRIHYSILTMVDCLKAIYTSVLLYIWLNRIFYLEKYRSIFYKVPNAPSSFRYPDVTCQFLVSL